MSPWAARHEGKFVCFVVSTTKQLRAASVSGWAHGGGWREADSLAFTTKLASVPVWLRPVLKPDSYHSRAESRSKVGQIRLWCWSFSEAPSWSFGEASPNDSEGASVAFMARTCCASDHESSSVAFGAGFRRAVMKGLKRPSLGCARVQNPQVLLLFWGTELMALREIQSLHAMSSMKGHESPSWC